MPRTPVMAVAALLRPARPGDDGVHAAQEDREARIMSAMDGPIANWSLAPESMAEIEGSRISATLEGASA